MIALKENRYGARIDADDVRVVQPDGLDQGRGRERELLLLSAGGNSGADACSGASGTRDAGRYEVTPRRILFVWPSAQWSTADVARGYRRALAAQGHVIHDYMLWKRLLYHEAAMGEDAADEHPSALALQASDNILPEALRFGADLVFIVSAHAVHPDAIALLQRCGIPVAVLFTESPYEDEDQLHFARFCDVVFTNERCSARRYGWHYLAHAYDPALHYPGAEPDQDFRSDVLMIASGWPERQRLLEGIDWRTAHGEPIDFKLRGIFLHLTEASPIWPHYQFQMVDNDASIARAYAATKIALNHHRYGAGAESLNPRAFELAACGTFFLTDERAEGTEVFGDVVPVYRTATECAAMIRHYLAHPEERAERAAEARRLVEPHTFTARAERLMAVINQAIPVGGK